MSSQPRHPYPDQQLVETLVDLGCLAPAFTRAQHPGCFAMWEDRAHEVLRLAGLLPAGRTTERLEGLKRECDRFTGQPLEAGRVPFTHARRVAEIVDLALVAVIVFAALLTVLMLLPTPIGQGSRLDEAKLFGPKIGMRATALRFGPQPTRAADARP